MITLCPVCSETSSRFTQVSQFTYFECSGCSLLFIQPELLDQMDSGKSPVTYRDDYWSSELIASKDRAYGSSLARVAELFHYSRIEIKSFLDIGTGSGHLLDALQMHLPSSEVVFTGVELMPPPPSDRSVLSGYKIGWLDQFSDSEFDGGSCIEVLEHLTPKMAADLFENLFRVAKVGSSWIFNTGLVDYVKFEDRDYLDPSNRGHVVSWSLSALEILCGRLGWQIQEIPGKTWAFLLEKPNLNGSNIPLEKRIWSPIPTNMSALEDSERGSVLRILGLESARAYSN